LDTTQKKKKKQEEEEEAAANSANIYNHQPPSFSDFTNDKLQKIVSATSTVLRKVDKAKMFFFFRRFTRDKGYYFFV